MTGLDVLVVPDVKAAQLLVGSSDRVESGYVNTYVATYSPEHDAGYYAVTTDLGVPITAARTRLADLMGATSATSEAGADHQTVLVFSRFSGAQIDGTLNQVRDAVTAADIYASFYYEPSVDAVLLDVGSDDPGAVPLPATDVPVQVRTGRISDDFYAENMRSPFAGGGTIYDIGNGRCTSGIPAFNSVGTPGYFTAAHCYPTGTTVYTSDWHSGTSISGTVTQRAFTSYVDAEFVSGATYAGSIYVTDTTTKRISSAYFPAAGAGNLLCFAGSTNSVICDNAVITYQGEYCGSTGCNSDLIALRGGTSSQNGDSGGPAFAFFGSSVKVTGLVRGHYDPTIGQSTTFITDWRKITGRYGASLMTG